MTLDRFIVKATADAFGCTPATIGSRVRGRPVPERMLNARRIATRVLKSFWYTGREIVDVLQVGAGSVSTLYVESFEMDGDPRLEAVTSKAYAWRPNRPSIPSPIFVVSEVFGVPVREVLGANRQRRSSLARSVAVAMYRAKGMSYSAVRSRFDCDVDPRHSWVTVREWAATSPNSNTFADWLSGNSGPVAISFPTKPAAPVTAPKIATSRQAK